MSFLTIVTRWSRSTSNLYPQLIGQNLTCEFKRKIYAVPGNLLLVAEADRVLFRLVMFLTAFFHWKKKIKYSCHQDSSVIMTGLIIVFMAEKCTACQSNSFCFSPCLMGKRVDKSQAILALLDGFQEPHIHW